MGTRGAYGFTVAGKSKISYNHYDSYPSCLGKSIVNFLSCNNIVAIENFAKSVKMVDANKKPTVSQIKKLTSLDINVEKNNDWYNLLRSHQGELQELYSAKIPFMTNEENFMKDSLFCEYAYIINLDEGVLEYYVGFNKTPILEGRFANAPHNEGGYYPVRLIKTYPLADLYACDVAVIIEDMEQVSKS